MSLTHQTLRTALLAAAAVLSAPAALHPAQQFQVHYNFAGKADGANPRGSLLLDSAGNLYGTTVQGGSGGYGVVFRLSPDRTQTPLYSFTGGEDGHYAYGGLVQDQNGALYGVTTLGGTYGEGNVFKLDSAGTLSVLYSFQGRPDGSTPEHGLTMDKTGNFFGTTPYGGYGDGIIFKLTPDGTETILHNFADGYDDGAYPYGGVTIDKKGNIYGTTLDGGSDGLQQGPGVLYKLASRGKFRVLHHFTDSTGDYPAAAPLLDASGNLYGTTSAGGNSGAGVLYKLAPDGNYAVLHSFAGGNDGEYGIGRLVMDQAGNLYGVATEGGSGCDCGTVFKLGTDGTYTILHTFTGSDGRYPADGLIINRKGQLFGTTYQGGKNDAGVVFKIRN